MRLPQYCSNCARSLWSARRTSRIIETTQLTRVSGDKITLGQSSKMNDDNIEIRVVTPGDDTRLMEFLYAHYYQEEPLTIGCEPKQPDSEDNAFLLSNIPHQTCLMAVLDERIVGAVVAGPKTADEADHLLEEAQRLEGTKWGRILIFLERVERKANACERYGVQHALHAHALAVDATLRGHAIGARLMRQLAEVGRRLAYPLLTVDCTSVYSARLIAKLGYELINVTRYEHELNEQGEQLICPPAPHECVQTYALCL